MNRNSLFYLIVLSVIACSIFWILQLGATLPKPQGAGAKVVMSVPTAEVSQSAVAAVSAGISQNLNSPLGHLFMQLVLIIAASRLMGAFFGAIGQPPVVGEMAMGILLGPSLFGAIAPAAFAFVFPASSFGTLKLLSQVGVCLFMFAVGMELNVGMARKKASTAILVSHAGIVIPYLLGVIVSYFLFTELAAAGTTFTAFALFTGISMSITAFPVLARILKDRGLTDTTLGTTAITCAAVDDVTAWSILAFVVAIVQSTSVAGAGLNLLLVLVFAAVMIFGLKRLLPVLIGRGILDENPSRGVLAVVVCVVVSAALCTEAIGIHALFGAFLAGTIMPDREGFRHKLGVRIENFSSVLLLPLFFVFTGLRTQVGLLNNWQDWLLCLLLILVATAGKLGGTAITARFTGMRWRESLQLGALMNTRGLMELIALNIGYDLGILSTRFFTMLIIMALVTTVLTGPLLTLFSARSSAFSPDSEPLHS